MLLAGAQLSVGAPATGFSSDGSQLRWPADAVARKVLATMFAQDDAARDRFLRDVSGTDWWSAGDPAPSGNPG